MTGNAILKFFKDKRNLSIHAEPVVPAKQISLNIKEFINIHDSTPVEIHKEDDGQVVSNPKDSTVEVNFSYNFSDWNGSEDAIELSHKYLVALESFLKSAFDNEIISR